MQIKEYFYPKQFKVMIDLNENIISVRNKHSPRFHNNKSE